MEYILIDTVVLYLQALYNIRQQFLLFLKNRQLTSIHPVLILESLLGISAEHQGEDHIIHERQGQGNDEEHQHLAKYLQHRCLCLLESEIILIVFVLTHDLPFSLLLCD